jgi:hypothetical protein
MVIKMYWDIEFSFEGWWIAPVLLPQTGLKELLERLLPQRVLLKHKLDGLN